MKKTDAHRSSHYETLQISRTAGLEVIMGAYEFLAHKWHPDRNTENSDEARQMRGRIKEAFSVLSDPKRRADYDLWLNDHNSKVSSSTGWHSGSFQYLNPLNEQSSRFRQPGVVRRASLMLIFAAALVMIFGVFPYQLMRGEINLHHLHGAAIWMAVGYYAYTSLFPSKPD